LGMQSGQAFPLKGSTDDRGSGSSVHFGKSVFGHGVRVEDTDDNPSKAVDTEDTEKLDHIAQQYEDMRLQALESLENSETEYDSFDSEELEDTEDSRIVKVVEDDSEDTESSTSEPIGYPTANPTTGPFLLSEDGDDTGAGGQSEGKTQSDRKRIGTDDEDESEDEDEYDDEDEDDDEDEEDAYDWLYDDDMLDDEGNIINGSFSSKPLDDDDLVHLGALMLEIHEGTKHEHKITHHRIMAYLNETGQDMNTVDIRNLSNHIEKQVHKAWNPDHAWFLQNIQHKRDEFREEQHGQWSRTAWNRRHVTYPEMLRSYNIDPAYRYIGWEKIMEQHKDEPWTDPYTVPGLNGEGDGEEDEDDIHIEEEGPDQRETKEGDEDLTARDIDDVIQWDKLDKIQQHYLQSGDHRAMRKFISDLDVKQSGYLKWLLFCYHHPDNCDDGHHPFEAMEHDLSASVFGEAFPWDDLIRKPVLTESYDHNLEDILQLEFISLGTHQYWLPTKEEERNHLPSMLDIKHAAGVIAQFLEMEGNTLVVGGVELSKGHVPRTWRQRVECVVLRALQDALHQNEAHSRTKFLRYQTYLPPDANRRDPALYGESFRTIPSCLHGMVSAYI